MLTDLFTLFRCALFVHSKSGKTLKYTIMTNLTAIKKANKTGIIITATSNGHHYFENKATGKKGSAWLEDGNFELPSKIHSDEDCTAANDMNDLFRYLNR